MADDFAYISRARLEYRDGYRRAYLGEVPEPVHPEGCPAHQSVKDAIAITWDATLRAGEQTFAVREA